MSDQASTEAGGSPPPRRVEPVVFAVGALTLLAFALRLSAIRQSLFGDELILFRAVHDRGLGSVLHVVRDTESTPPLHFVLAWASAKIGDPTVWVRLPSLVFGTATVPLVYLLGARTIGRSAGLVAAALMAIAPFAIFYGVEARAYATLGFLVTLSTLALLQASRSGRRRWWIVFAATTCAALYTHYTAIFVLVAQIGWALWAFPRQRRALALATGATALLYLPWIPSFLVQRRDSAEQRYTDPDSVVDGMGRLLRAFPGHPFAVLDEIPGRPWLIAFLAVVGLTAAAALWERLRSRGEGEPPGRGRDLALIAVLALASPVGVVLYSLGPTSIFGPRSLISSLPAVCVGVAALLTRLGRPWREAAVASVLVLVGIGTTKTLSDEYQRPALRQVAEYLHNEFHAGDAVLNATGYLTAPSLSTHLEGRPPLLTAGPDDATAWEHASNGGSVFVIRDQAGLTIGMRPLEGPDNRFVRREVRRWPGLVSVAVGRYSGELEASVERRAGGEAIAWSLGKDLPVTRGALHGSVEAVTTADGRLTIKGWAADGEAHLPADWILAFSGPRFIGIVQPYGIRPDVAKVYGQGAIVSGFGLTAKRGELAHPARLRLFAVVGDRVASRLEPGRLPREAAALFAPG